MFGIGTTELLLILVVALIVLGPKKLPEIARSLGKGLAEFRRVSTDFQRSINLEVEQDEMKRRKQEAENRLFPDNKTPSDAHDAQSLKPDAMTGQSFTPDNAPGASPAPAAEREQQAPSPQSLERI